MLELHGAGSVDLQIACAPSDTCARRLARIPQEGLTALAHAAQSGKAELVKLLLQRGAATVDVDQVSFAVELCLGGAYYVTEPSAPDSSAACQARLARLSACAANPRRRPLVPPMRARRSTLLC